jgi:hypothetical protein
METIMLRLHIAMAAAAAVVLSATSFAQPPTRPARPVPQPTTTAQLVGGNVVIHERKNFTGRSATLAPGDHRLTDWKPASIQVPPGVVAYLYQSADAAGGFGISVDLLEDHRDLSPFGLDGNVSFISVVPIRQGFFWARGRMENGQFVPGHWERNRAAGNPVNTVAVASPPIPSRLPPGPTSIQQQGTTWTIASLGPQSSEGAARWNGANATMGVVGSDYRGIQEIGSAAFERASNNFAIPDWINFWYPNKQRNDHRSVVYFKRTLTGVIADKLTKNWSGQVPDGRGGVRTISGTYDRSDVPHVADISGTYPDHDLNIDVFPFVDFMYLIKDSHAPERSTALAMKDLVDSDHDPCTDPFIVVEAEVDAGNVAKQTLASMLAQRIGKQVAMFGPWIYDIGHCDHPEIHPAEQIWWVENAPDRQLYHLNVFADSSERFWWRSQMDDGTKLHPWGAPPITGVYAIAFEVPIDTIAVTQATTKRFEVTNVDHWNVTDVPDSDKVYNLVYGSRTLVSFVPHNNAFKVSYEHVGLKPGTNNVVRGFLVIETTVGIVKQIATRVILTIGNQQIPIDVPQGADPDTIDQRIERQVFKKEGGHYLFTVTQTDVAGGLVVR